MHSLSLASVLLAGGDGFGSAASGPLMVEEQSLALLLSLLLIAVRCPSSSRDNSSVAVAFHAPGSFSQMPMHTQPDVPEHTAPDERVCARQDAHSTSPASQ